jgi:hypothetical protein
MIVRNYNALSRADRREIDRAIDEALATRERQYPVTRRCIQRVQSARRATERFAASCAGLAGLVAALACCTANVRSEAAWCVVFGLWMIVFFAGGAWMVDEWQKWRASR